MKPRFPLGLTFMRKRFPKATDLTEYRIDDIYITTSYSTGKVVQIEYEVSHVFMGQRVSELMVDTTIARSLSNEELQRFL